MSNSHKIRNIATLLLCGLCLSVGAANAASKKPNILVIMGDDCNGQVKTDTNLSHFSK